MRRRTLGEPHARSRLRVRHVPGSICGFLILSRSSGFRQNSPGCFLPFILEVSSFVMIDCK